jgi:hypothetical protein
VERRQQVRRLFPLFPQGAEAQRVMALGEAFPPLIPHQLAVVPGRRRNTQRSRQQNLPRRRLEQISPADDLGDPHGCIVHHHGELVRGKIVPAPYQEVAKILPGHGALAAELQILEFDGLTVGNAKTPASAGFVFSVGAGGTARSGIDSFVVVWRLFASARSLREQRQG